jgi:hypothetical protein
VDYSYTHNWPYDELAGNRPGAPVMMWSVIAALGLIAVLGVVLFLYGRYSSLAGWRQGGADEQVNLAALARVETFGRRDCSAPPTSSSPPRRRCSCCRSSPAC